ncbi:MAG: hypothetical protein ACHQLQ_05145 [Candidatus Acidiferrales bacterium]
MPNGQQQTFTNIQPIAPPKQTFTNVTPVDETKPDTGVWAGVKRNTVGMVAGLYHALTDPATDQEKAQLMKKVQDEKAWQTAHGYDPNQVDESVATDPSRATLAYHRLIDAPAGALAQKGEDEQAAAKDLLSKGQTWKGSDLYVSGATDRLLSAVPGAGPWLNSVAQRAERGDISGAATDVAAAVAYSNAPEIARATGVPDKLADFFRSSAQKNYEDVLNPTRVDTKYQTQQIMPQLMEEAPIAMTRKGLAAKAAGQADIAGQQIEEQVSGLQGDMKTQPVIDRLENLRQKYQVNGVSLRPEVDSAIDTLQDQLRGISQQSVKGENYKSIFQDAGLQGNKVFRGMSAEELEKTATTGELQAGAGYAQTPGKVRYGDITRNPDEAFRYSQSPILPSLGKRTLGQQGNGAMAEFENVGSQFEPQWKFVHGAEVDSSGNIIKMYGQLGERTMSYQDVVRARRILDDAVAEVGGYQGRPLSDTSMANIRKATANSFREELGNASPDLAAVNAKFHFWNTLNDVLEQTIQRKTGQVNALPKMETVIAGAGGLARSGLSGAAAYAGAMNLLGKVVRSTAWRTVSAATKSGIADALTTGNFGAVKGLLLGGQALSQSAASSNGYGAISASLSGQQGQAAHAGEREQ